MQWGICSYSALLPEADIRKDPAGKSFSFLSYLSCLITHRCSNKFKLNYTNWNKLQQTNVSGDYSRPDGCSMADTGGCSRQMCLPRHLEGQVIGCCLHCPWYTPPTPFDCVVHLGSVALRYTILANVASKAVHIHESSDRCSAIRFILEMS